MRNPKYHLYLTYDERRTVINSLIDLKNHLVTQGKYTDAVDVYIPPREHHLHGVLAPRSRGFSATLYGTEHHPL